MRGRMRLSVRDLLPSRARSRSRETGISERSDNKTNRDDEYGLLCLSPHLGSASENLKNAHAVDIVAVHGLGGQRLRTWKNNKGEIWLQDWLPTSLPGARIYTYGYNSDPVFSNSKFGIDDFARRLLADLLHRPDGKASRPIIFICHSLGGIVCKQALLMAFNDPHYTPIYKQTVAILFLGTPHRGAGKADQADLAATIIGVLNTAEFMTGRAVIRRDLIKTLKSHSRDLERLSEAFSHRAKDFEIVTFYEGRPSPLSNSVLVPEHSAVIHDEIKIPMDSDHHQICKFESATSWGYNMIVKHIEDILNKRLPLPTGPEQPCRDEDASDILSTIDTFNIQHYKNALPQPVDGTCEWLEKDAIFLSWLEQKTSSILWITGHPGSGKSMLSAHMVDYLRNNKRIHAIVCYFFIVENISDQNNSVSILRSVIAQFLRQRPVKHLIRRARKLAERRQLDRLDCMWDLFITLIGDPSAGVTILIVDALDECDEKSRDQLLDHIARLFDKRGTDAGLEKANLKLILTSRREPSLESKLFKLPTSRLELENHQAIREAIALYIHEKVAEMMQMTGSSKDTATTIEKSLQEKAENTYIWVRVACEQMALSMSLEGGASIEHFQEIVKDVPRETEHIYEAILRRIPIKERSLVVRLLRIITSACRPLTVKELNIAEKMLRYRPKTLSELDRLTEGNFERALGCLRGLVRVADSRVYIIHQTAIECLTRISKSPPPSVPSEFHDLLKDVHADLADVCISFLTFPELEESLFCDESECGEDLEPIENEDDEGFGLSEFFGDNWSKEIESMNEAHPFFDYAALNWMKHFSKREGALTSELIEKYAQISSRDQAHQPINWLRYVWFWFGNSNDECPGYFNPLIVAAYFGHGDMLRHLLADCSTVPSLDLNLALGWASRMGHADVVNTLLIKGADPVSTLEHWTPLAWASYSGSLDTVRVLLRFSKEHTNIIERWGQTPLSLAASGGYLDVVKELGSLEGVAIDIPDSKGYTPLFKAATEGHPKVVAWMLRDGRSDVNHRLSSGQTMLFGAAEYGYGDIVKSLLEQKELDPNIRDKKGRSALSWAAEKAPLSIVQRLANDTRVDIQSADKDGRNAFSWSCWSKDPRVLEYFIRINPKNVDLPATRDKCTPLHYVILGHREHAEDSIRMLLATGSVDINKQDHNGRTALSLAASEGQLKLVQVLVENGADIGLMDNDGWSPVQWAAQVANTAGGGEVIQYLKSKM